MPTHVFYNPELVDQLATCGITARRRSTPGAPPSGFVVGGRRPPLARSPVTNTIAVHRGVTITGSRQLAPIARAPTAPLLLAAPAAPQTAVEMVEECARLRRDNQRLAGEVTRLRAEVDRLIAGPAKAVVPPQLDLDDSARRFALLELD